MERRIAVVGSFDRDLLQLTHVPQVCTMMKGNTARGGGICRLLVSAYL